MVTTLNGNKDLDSEELLAYELGYRQQLNPRFSIDLATFYNDYDKLRRLSLANPRCSPAGSFPGCFPPMSDSVITPIDFTNEMEGSTYGLELAADWHATQAWRLQAAYSYLEMRLDVKDDDPIDEEGRSPKHQASLRSSADLVHNIKLDFWLRYVDPLPSFDIDSYVTLDTRLAWWPREDLELSVVGQNLLDSQHAEFISEGLCGGLRGQDLPP